MRDRKEVSGIVYESVPVGRILVVALLAIFTGVYLSKTKPDMPFLEVLMVAVFMGFIGFLGHYLWTLVRPKPRSGTITGSFMIVAMFGISACAPALHRVQPMTQLGPSAVYNKIVDSEVKTPDGGVTRTSESLVLKNVEAREDDRHHLEVEAQKEMYIAKQNAAAVASRAFWASGYGGGYFNPNAGYWGGLNTQTMSAPGRSAPSATRTTGSSATTGASLPPQCTRPGGC